MCPEAIKYQNTLDSQLRIVFSKYNPCTCSQEDTVSLKMFWNIVTDYN